MITSTKINPILLGRSQAILFGLLGLVFGMIYAFGGLLVDIAVSLHWISTAETPGLSTGTLLAFGALAGMPLLFAAAGFILGIILGILYNSALKIFPALSRYVHLKS